MLRAKPFIGGNRPRLTRSYYPASLLQKYQTHSYSSYKAGGLVGWAATTDPTMNYNFTFNTNINVKQGDLLVVIPWLTGTDNGGGLFTIFDNLGSTWYTVPSTVTGIGGSYNCGASQVTPCPPGSGSFTATPYTTGPNTPPTLAWGIPCVATAPAAGSWVVTIEWDNNLDTVPGYAVFVFRGQVWNGNLNYPNNWGLTASGNSASITTSGLANVMYHYALLVAYVSNNPSYNALPGVSAQGFKQVLTWGDSCLNVCSPAVATLSDALYIGYKYSPNDFTFNLQFTYAGATLYGYAIIIV